MEQPTRFADAMMGVGWLVESAKAVELLRLTDHNSASATEFELSWLSPDSFVPT
jgi:hypothetical protein